MTGPTLTLCEFVAAARREAMPADLFALARHYVLDTIGAMIIGATKPWSRIVMDYSLGDGNPGGGRCTVVGATTLTSPQMAAFANGNMGHGFEIDDVHDESLVHPGTVVVPAALAVAEASKGSGAEFLTAVVLGYEVMCRVGLAVGAVPHMLGGFYPTGTNGVFGAAAASGRLLGSDARRLAHAMGIAGSFASGIVEYAQSGGMVKRLHAGRAAEGGVTAAYLAQAGFTGPITAIEGRYGFCNSFSSAPAIDRLLDGLGSNYAIRDITVKPYACCSDIHPVIDALLEIRERDRPDPARVDHVLVESTTKLYELNNIDGTTAMMAAQYSVPFTVGLALLRDIRDPAIYRDETLQDPQLRAMQSKVEMCKSAEFDAIYPRTIGAKVTLRMADGRELTATNRGAKGSIHNPLSKAEIEAKFARLATPIVPPGDAERILGAVDRLDDAPDLCALTALLRFDVARAAN